MPASAQATTDAAGKFTLTGLPRGYLQLFAFGKGRQQLDALAVHTTPAEGVTIRMTATGTIRGKVSTQDGKPGDHSVTTQAAGDPIGKWGGSMNVGQDGTFLFEDVPPGKYYIAVDAPPVELEKNPRAKLVEVKMGVTTEVDIQK